jgi:hypothetical protein
VTSDDHISLALAENSLAHYNSKAVSDRVGLSLSTRKSRKIEGGEIVLLSRASDSLLSRGLISQEAHALFQDFLGSDKLKKVEV